MATKEELFAAVRLIKKNCTDIGQFCITKKCPLFNWCSRKEGYESPEGWPDPEEGGGEDG